jgi:translation initiation factor 2B subunit (eIF-2B alpha/beta/delta family)
MERVDILIERMVHQLEEGSEESNDKALEYLNIVLAEGTKSEIAEMLSAFVYSKYDFVRRNIEKLLSSMRSLISRYKARRTKGYFALLFEAVRALSEYLGEKRAVELFSS